MYRKNCDQHRKKIAQKIHKKDIENHWKKILKIIGSSIP